MTGKLEAKASNNLGYINEPKSFDDTFERRERSHDMTWHGMT